MSVLKFANPIRVGSLTSDPSSSDDGTIYYNSSTGKFRQLQAGSWTDMGQSELTDSLFRILNDADPTKEIAFDASGIATGTTRTITMPNSNVDLGLIATAIQSSEKGANNGVATLDAGGKVPVAQLPNSVMEYKGVYNANTNSPSLADGSGNTGDVYRVSVAGSQDFGSGSIAFVVGDYVIYNGSVWEKAHSGADAVTSVNGFAGVVVLTTDNVAEGSVNLYYTAARFNTAFAGKTTDNLTEGSTNLYFTNARAQSAVVIDSIADADTTHAPSRNAVFDALALKLSSVSQDTTPQLGGNLDLNGKTLMGLLHTSAAADGSNFLEREYIHASTLTASQTAQALAALTFAFASFEGMEMTYKIKEATTNRVRIGTLRVVTDGTNVSITDTYNETADVGVTWTAAISGSNVEVRYTTTANNKTMRSEVIRIKA